MVALAETQSTLAASLVIMAVASDHLKNWHPSASAQIGIGEFGGTGNQNRIEIGDNNRGGLSRDEIGTVSRIGGMGI